MFTEPFNIIQHDTYADRMNILSIIYSIPAVPYPSSGLYAALTDSTASTSPTNSASPSSDSSPQMPLSNEAPNQYPSDMHLGHDRNFDGKEGINSVMFNLDESRSPISGLPHSSQHPYAITYDPPAQSVSSAPAVSRSNTLTRRARASSNLGPPPPPPSNNLPPAPSVDSLLDPAPTQKRLDARARQRGESVGHHRTGSSGLGPLKEEYDDTSIDDVIHKADEVLKIDPAHPDIPSNLQRDSHPLPPLPSPSTDSSGTPRTPSSKAPSSPPPSNVIPPRSRVSSLLNARSETTNLPIINQSINQGTIHQRRTKSSAPPASRSSSPADSTVSAGSIPGPKPTSSSLPGASPLGSATGRSRSSSQPGRRPSLIGSSISPDQRPPLPGNVGNGTGSRKTSIPSKFHPPPQLSKLTVQTDLPSSVGNTPFSLVPPAVLSGNLPTTPISTLPPPAPNDPLLKPYHLMNLLRDTMTSATGGYITRRLHVPHEVWSQGGAKLSNLVEKVHVVAILSSALEDLQVTSSEYFGAGNVSSGLAMGIGSIGRKEADAWLSKLDEFSSVCDGVVTKFGKKLGVGEGFVLKKTTWGDKLTRRFDKFTNGKK